MKMIQALFARNKALAWLGTFFLMLSIVLAILIPGNAIKVLGINSLLKPFKFAVSLWIYSWTMAYIVSYFKNEVVKKRLVFLIVFVMLFEQLIITVQAFRGRLSHFNIETTTEHMLFNLMGVFITLVTAYTLYAAFKFKNQKDELPLSKKYAIFYGMVIFVIAGFMGGVMGALLSHNVGGEMGGEGLPLINWSTTLGDIRVAHFIGIHALQVIPFVGYMTYTYILNKKSALAIVRGFSLLYLLFVVAVFVQALMGMPFIT